jgi:hypothetical protein
MAGWLRNLIDVVYTTEMGLEIDQQSAWILTLIGTEDREAFKVFGVSDAGCRIRGGHDLIPTRLSGGEAIENRSAPESVRAGLATSRTGRRAHLFHWRSPSWRAGAGHPRQQAERTAHLQAAISLRPGDWTGIRGAMG